MKVNIGKNTLGDNDKMSVTLKNYNRSTHDLSYAWRSPMGVGTLVPFMKILALPGDTFDIDLNTKIMTHPTVGPLFGTFKFQADVFTCPIRLYNAMLHNNALNIGMDMKTVKLPKAKPQFTYQEDYKTAKGSIAQYFGLNGEPKDKTGEGFYLQIVPYLAYYDIFKNYYANKQEKYFQIMGGSILSKKGDIISSNINGSITSRYEEGHWIKPNGTVTVKVSKSLDITSGVIFLLNGAKVKMKTPLNITSVWNKTEDNTYNIYTLVQGQEIMFETYLGGIGETIELTGYTQNITEGQPVESYTSSYELEEIDELREYILGLGRKEFKIDENSDETLKNLFIWKVFQGNGTVPKEQYIKPLIRTELGGLCLKTLQSDIFNNWVNKEWVDGDNGIAAITAIDVSDGKLTIDSINLAEKVYNMLNRIAVSGGTYKDWIETVYDTNFYFRAETPIYEGGMSTMIDFEPVVSTADGRNGEEPLGTLAGRGVSGERKGGKIEIKVTEPCYIIGIASITPLVDYSQGNEWDNWLETLDDLHKPELDAIGYQDLMANTMHYRAKTTDAIGKQPAWLNYMTNYNRSYGNFAQGKTESYMVLNRVYDVDEEDGTIKNATTYINPKDYTYIFATNTDTNTDFWVQIGAAVEARRVMSAKQIPLM